MGLNLDVVINDTPDGIRVEISGEGGETLLRRRAEALDALQVIVNTAFRRELNDDRSFTVDCLDYRKGKDEELRQMTRFTMERVKTNRHAAGNGSAQSVHAPHRPHDGCGGPGAGVREHR